MPSFEDRFYRENPGLIDRLRRNARLIAWLAGALLAWLTVGRRTRKAYARAKDSGEPLVLEDLIEDEQA